MVTFFRSLAFLGGEGLGWLSIFLTAFCALKSARGQQVFDASGIALLGDRNLLRLAWTSGLSRR